jgi:C4-dicarboxylate-binding protein DctP
MMMRAFVLVLTLVFLISPTLGAVAQEIKLRATLQVPASEPFLGASLVRFKDEVERRLNREVSIEIFDKAQLYKEDQVIDAVASGGVEMGFAGFNFFVDKVPAVGILEQPFLFNFDALVRATTTPGSEVRGIIDAAILATTGVRVLSWQTIGNTVLFSKGRDISDPEQLRGRRVRVFSKTLEEFTTRCGGTPDLIPVSKLHDALGSGTVDVAMVGMTALQSRELWKVTDTVTRTNHALYEYFLIISEKVWQTLSARQRDIMAEVARTVELQTRERASQNEATTLAFGRAKGMVVRELTPDQVAEWRACSSDVLLDYMNRNGAVAAELMAAYARLRTDSCCSAGPSTEPIVRR